MPVDMKPVGEIKAKLGIEPNGLVQRYFTSSCAKHMDKYVPRDKGILRLYVIEGPYIIYETPYARYQYYGVRNDGTHKVKHYTTPGTGPYWDRRMKSAEIKDIEDEIQSLLGGK